MKATRRIRRLLKDLQAFADTSNGKDESQEDPENDDDVLSDVTKTGEGGSKSTPLDTSGCSDTDTSTPTDSHVSKALHHEVERLVEQLGDSRVLVATLEAELKFLLQENARQHDQHKISVQRLEAEVERLEDQAHKDMAELKRRQDQIELEVPALEQQLECLKEVLRDLNVSEHLYLELLSVPEEKRSIKAHLQVLAYEKMKGYREEMEATQKERDTSREILSRENAEVVRLQREVQRLSAAAALDKIELEKEASAVKARNERLEAELQESLVKVELLSAKGSMYDEVKENLEKAEQRAIDTENQKVVMAATLQVATDEKQRLLEVIKDKDHCLDLLSMDKIYLSREVKSHLDQIKKLEQELEHQQEKLKALKATRQELYNRVLSDSKDTQAAHEMRLQAELSRLQERAHQDIEHIRKEASEVAEEKVRNYREMRDTALAEAERLQAILRDSKSSYDELLTKYQELQRVSERREIEARSDIKVRDFELEQLRVTQQEMKCILNQKSIDNEALSGKVKILTEKYHAMEMETEKPLALMKQELDMTRARLRQCEQHTLLTQGPYLEHASDGSSGLKKHCSVSIDPGKQGLQSFSVIRRSIQVQTSGSEIPNEGTDFRGKPHKVLQDKMNRSNSAEQDAYGFSVFQDTEESLYPTERTKTNLESELKKVKTENQHVCRRLHNLQHDLRRILQARGTLENLQSLLKEKGIHISDDVLKRITRAKGYERE